MQGEGHVVVRGRVEIDERRPFRSVKEAVALFGEKILAGEIYGNKNKEVQEKIASNAEFAWPSKTVELEEAKKSLEKAKEEGNLMAHSLDSLKQELERTKIELQHLKSSLNLDEESRIEEVKFIENAAYSEDGLIQFQPRRSVKFAASPLLPKTVIRNGEEASPCKKETKKKTFARLLGGLLVKRNGGKDGESTSL